MTRQPNREGRLQGKVAIVTGAGSSGPGWGNGKATAVLFASEGAKVFAVDLRPEALQETKQVIERESGECTGLTADVSHAEEVKALVDALHENLRTHRYSAQQCGNPHGGRTRGNLRGGLGPSVSSQRQEHVLDLQARIAGHGGTRTRCDRQHLVDRFYPIYRIPTVAYNASKGVVNQLTQNIAVQYASKGVRANCMLPDS